MTAIEKYHDHLDNKKQLYFEGWLYAKRKSNPELENYLTLPNDEQNKLIAKFEHDYDKYVID